MNDLARLETAYREGTTVISLVGEVDLSNARELSAAIEAAVPGDSRELILDLSATEYLDSAGISMLFRLASRLGPRRQSFRLVVPTDSPVRSVLELTGVPAVIPLDAPAGDAPASDS